MPERMRPTFSQKLQVAIPLALVFAGSAYPQIAKADYHSSKSSQGIEQINKNSVAFTRRETSGLIAMQQQVAECNPNYNRNNPWDLSSPCDPNTQPLPVEQPVSNSPTTIEQPVSSFDPLGFGALTGLGIVGGLVGLSYIARKSKK